MGVRSPLCGMACESERGGKLDIRLELKVTLDEDQAVFAMTVENHSGVSSSKMSTAPTWAMCSTPRMRNGSRPSSIPMPPPMSGASGRTYDNLRGYYGDRLSLPSSTRRAILWHAHVALLPHARAEPGPVRGRCQLQHASTWPGTPSCARATAARSMRASLKGWKSPGTKWRPALPLCMSLISSPAKRGR